MHFKCLLTSRFPHPTFGSQAGNLSIQVPSRKQPWLGNEKSKNRFEGGKTSFLIIRAISTIIPFCLRVQSGSSRFQLLLIHFLFHTCISFNFAFLEFLFLYFYLNFHLLFSFQISLHQMGWPFKVLGRVQKKSGKSVDSPPSGFFQWKKLTHFFCWKIHLYWVKRILRFPL